MRGAAVVVGVLEVRLSLPGVSSMKEKRSVVRSLVERTRNRFNISVAEVDANDVHEQAVIGLSTVSNDASFANSVLDKALASLEEQALGRANVIDTRLELLHF